MDNLILKATVAPLLNHLLSEDGRGAATDLVVNEPGVIYLRRRSKWERINFPDLDLNKCREIATLVASANQRECGFDKPLLSATLPDGERILIVHPPLCSPDRILFAIRRPRVEKSSYDELCKGPLFNIVPRIFEETLPYQNDMLQIYSEFRSYMRRERPSLPDGIYDFLKIGIRNRLNIAVSGPTGSGKTTLINALLELVDPDLRLVFLEDVREAHRLGNSAFMLFESEGVFDLTQTVQQLKNAFNRMMPDIVMVPELRAGYTFEFFEIVSNGHEGTIFGMHAPTVSDVWDVIFQRLTREVGNNVSEEYRRRLMIKTIDVIVVMNTNYQIVDLYYDPVAKLAAKRGVAG